LPTEETLRIEKLVYGGDGLARHEGKVILIPYVLPGELVRVEMDRAKNDLWRGRLLEVIERSPARVPAPCEYFERCGGCHYQHAQDSDQLEFKRAILREVLRRVGKIEFDGEIAAISGEPWQYRNRVQLHVAAGRIGYFEHGSHTLCPITHCPISSPALNQAIAKLSANVPNCTATVELFSNESETQVSVLDRVPRAAMTAFDSIGTGRPIDYKGFQVSRNSFFQVNRFLIDPLVDCALGSGSGASAVDLYAGVGLFAMRLAARYTKVTAVESSRSAFRDLEHNTQGRVDTINSSTEDFLATLNETPDLILADPPRAGLGKSVVRELVRIRAPLLTIVSCDPATLARDLSGLLVAGYRIESVALVDLFPQTYHLETVVQVVAG
jgi:23S rRNA (uracil1939-C5)-methyltransferase